MTTIILKVTEKCNSNCSYCDVVSNKKEAESMPLDVLEIVLERIDEYLKIDPQKKINLIWHGGEPLLLGPDYYEVASKLLQKKCGDTSNRIKQCMQSNLTLFSADYVDIFRSMGINQIGTSYDPVPNIRGPGFPSNSDLYNRQFMQGDALATKNGFSPGIIYVVIKKSLINPLKIFYFLSNFRPGGHFNLNPVLLYDHRRRDLEITPDEYVDFLGDIFPTWWKYQERYPNVEPFNSLTRLIRDGEMRLSCSESGMCSHQHVNIDPYGETSQCGRSSDWKLLQYGNIVKLSLSEIMSNPKRNILRKRNKILHQGECKDCRFWTICHGGCPLDPYPRHSDFMHRSEWGCARKTFIEKYFEPITGLRFNPHE